MRSHPLNGHMEEDFTVLETRTLNISPKPLFAKLDELVSNRQRAEAAGEKAAYVEQLDREIANLLRVFVEMGGRMRRDKGAVTLCVPRLSQAEPGEL